MSLFLKFFFAIQLCLVSSFDPSYVVLAINCGQLDWIRSSFGFDYSPDVEYRSSLRSFDYTLNSIARTKNPTLYQTAQTTHDPSVWWYQFPIPDDGNYVLILQFAEIIYSEANKRVFDIGLGTSYIYLENFDIYARVGAYNALDIFVDFFISSGIAYWRMDFSTVFKEAGEDFRVFFSNKIGDASISGIVLLKADCYQVDNCNMCYDKGCNDCDATIPYCNACVDTMTPVNGVCQCIEPSTYYKRSYLQCWQCDNLCEVCEGSQTLLCQTCVYPYVLISNICMKTCPYGFPFEGGRCIETTSMLINVHFDGDFAGLYGGFFRTGQDENTYSPFNSPENIDPTPAKNRGLYIWGKYLESNIEVYFSYNFSMGFWIWVEKYTDDWSHLLRHGKGNKLIASDCGKLSMSLDNEIGDGGSLYSTDMFMDAGVWFYLSYTVYYSNKVTSLNAYENNIKKYSFSVNEAIYRDDLDGNKIVIVGGSKIFLYAFHFWNVGVFDFSYAYSDDICGSGGIATCLWSCDISKWISNDGTATSCDSSCSLTGCVRSGTCNICDDPLCGICTSFKSNSCTQCVENASGSPCACDAPYLVSGSGSECIICSSSCQSCTGSKPYNCISCNPGYYLFENWCFIDNPNNYTPNSCIVSYEFMKISNVHYDSVNNYPIYMGNSDSYFPDYDASDPWILPYRGLYFNGNSLASLPEKNASSYGISLGLNHSFSIWSMVLPNNVNGAVYCVYIDTSYSIMISAVKYNSTSFKYVYSYNVTNINGLSANVLTVESPYYSFNIWQRVIVSYSYQAGSNLKMFIDDQMVKSKTLSSYFYYEYNHKSALGNLKPNRGFYGYIYSFKIYNYPIDSVSSWQTSSCGYPFCTDDNDSLISCQPLEFYDVSSKSCNTCSGSCLQGCARGDNSCSLHQNQLCQVYTNLKFNICETCKENANNMPPCTCADNFIYDAISESCICSDGSQPVDNQCQTDCIRYLQPSEITGYFTSSFLKIIFEFSIAINVTGLNCENVFSEITLTKFGSDYSCSIDSKKIIIELGKNFEIRNETVSLIKGSLKSGIECRYTAKVLNVDLCYSAPPPSPISTIEAPNTVLYDCEDLLISGKKSTGSVNCELEYKWEISSDPPLQSLAQFTTDFQKEISYFSIPRSNLPAASITVTLSIKNIFGNVDTNSIIIESIPNGISVNFDSAISYQLLATQSNFYTVGTISSCSDISELSLDWKLLNSTGNLTAIDENYIWENQKSVSSLYIPEKSIPSYTNVTFALSVTSLSSNIQGVGILEIYILPDSPVIQFSRIDGDADVNKALSIDASSSYDPNENITLDFTWKCMENNANGCSSLISTLNSSILNIPSNSLEVGLEYEFTLTAIAEFSNGKQVRAQKRIAITTVNYDVPDLNIFNALSHTQSNVISGGERVTLAASAKSGHNNSLSYEWSVKYGGPLEFTTPIDQYLIAISQGSLNIGSTYTLSLAVFDGSHYFSFFYTFYVNSPPYAGDLIVNPSEGIESQTVFKMEALDWIDEENNYPLTYAFGYLTDNNEAFMNIKNQSSTYSTTFPYLSSTLSVFVDVYDSLEEFSRKIVDIKLSIYEHLDQNKTFLDSLNYINSVTSNPKTYPGTISSLCSYILNRDYLLKGEFKEPSNDDMIFLQGVYNSTLLWTQKLIDKADLDSQTVSIFANLLEEITLNQYLVNDDTETKVFGMINNIIENFPENQMLLDKQIDDYFTVIDQTYNYNATSLVNKSDSLESGIDTINNLNKLVLSQMVINEKKIITTDEMDITLAVMESKSLDNFQLSSSSNDASVTLPENFSLVLENITSATEVGISMTLLKSPNNADSLSSSVVDFSMYDLQADNKIEVNMTSSYILIEIPAWNLRSSKFAPECVYLDTKSLNWSTQGCVTKKITSENIICNCSHFTSFAAIDAATSSLINSNIGDTVNVYAWTQINESNAIGLYFCIVTLIIYIILAIIAYRKDKKEEKIEEEARKKIRGTPKKLEKVIDKFEDDSKIKGKPNKEMKKSQRKKKSSIFCCKKKKRFEASRSKPDIKESNVSCYSIHRNNDRRKTNECSEFIEYDDETNKTAESKNSFLKCFKQRSKNKNNVEYQSEAFGHPDEVYVYSFTDDINSESTRTEVSEETKIQKWLGFFAKRHELFNILFTRVPQHSSFSRITLYFLVLIGQMFFIGLFYQSSTSTSSETVITNSTNSTSSDDNSSEIFTIDYSWHDFWVMVWSSLIMIIITFFLNKLFTEQEITEKTTEIQYLKIKRKNAIKRWIGMLLTWGLMLYFFWSIVLFAIQFDQNISRVWVLNTGISYTINIFFTSIVKAAITAYVTMKLLELVEKYKKKKITENNEL